MAFQSRLELIVDSRSGEQRLRAFENQLNRAEGAGDRLSEGMSVLKIALGAAAAAVGGFSVGRVVTETASFEQSLLKLQVVSGATATQMAALESQSRQLGATSVFSAKQAADAQNFLAMAGLNVNEVLSATPGILQLATAGQMDLASAADLASNVLGGFRLEVGELNRVNDVLAATAAKSNTSISQLGDALSYAAPIAATAGVSIEQTAAAIGVLSDAGLQSSRAGTGLLGFIRQLSNLTPDATAALGRYGLTSAEVNVEQEGLIAVLDRLQQANINTADSFKIFGSEAGPAAQILAAGAVRVNEFTGELELAEGTAERAALVLGSGLEGSFRSLNSAIGESILQLGRDSGMSAALQEVINTATGVISVYNGMLPQFREANDLTEDQARNLNTTATAISLTAGAVGGLTSAYVGLTAATWAAHAAQTAFVRIMRVNPIVLAAGAIASLSGALYTARNRTIEFGDTQASVSDWMSGAWQVNAQVFSENWDGAITSVIGLFESMAEPVGGVTSYIWETFKALMTNLGSIVQTTINSIIGYFSTIIDVVGIVTRTMQTLFTSAFDNILSVAGGFWDSVQAVFSGDLSFSAFNSAVDNLKSGFVETMAGAAGEIGSAFRENMGRDYLGEAFDSLSNGAQFVAADFEALGDRISDAAFVARMSRNGFGLVAEGFSEGKTQAQLLQEQLDQLNQSLADPASEEAAKAAKTLADNFESLKRQLDPSYSSLMDFWEGIELLNEAIDTTTIEGMTEYNRLVGLLTERYAEATKGSDDAAKRMKSLTDTYDRAHVKAQQLTADLAAINEAWRNDPANGDQYARMVASVREEMAELGKETDEMGREFERFGNTFDDTMVDMIMGATDGFDTIERAGKRMLAELLWAASKNEIRVRLGMQASGPLQGGFSQLLGMGKSDGLGSLISGGKTLLGLSAPAAASGTALSGGFMGAAATQSAGSLYGMAATGGVAQAGLASSIAAGISTAMPWIAGGLAIDSLLGGGITKAISGLFGGKSRGPSFDLMTTHQDPNTIFEDVQHGVTATGAFGNVGFHGGNTNRLEETFGSFDNATQFLETIAATDDLIASLAPGDVEAMTYAIQQMRLKSSDAAGIADQLGDRTKAAFGAMSGDFGAFARTLTGSTEEIIAQAQTTQQAHALLTSASERLGLQFSIAGGYAYEAAQDIAQLAGGVENLSALQQSYYQNFFTEAERAAHLTDDIAQALNEMGMQMPETRAGFRELVEAQDQATQAGRESYVQLLELESAFAQLTPAIEDAGSAADTASEALRMQVQLNRQLLQAQGDTDALRQLEIDALKEIQGWQEAGLVTTQKRIWAIEDEKEAQREAERAQQERIRAIEQEANAWQRAQQQLASFGVSIDNWIDNLRGTDAGLGTPGDQLAAASQAFDEQYAKALSGDQAALGSITQYADRFIEAQKGWSASGEQTVSTIDRVTGMLEKLPDQLSPEQFLAEEFKGIIDGQTSALLSGWNGGFDSLLSGLSADFGALDTSLDGLLSFDELKAGLAGKATDSELRALIGAVDKNGDGLISRQELTNATISDLRLGITSTLSKSFADLDSNVDGLLTFGELKAGLGGIATDETLRAMMHGMDLNSDGVINKLESVVIAEMPNDAVLTNVLKNKMDALGSKTLTAVQVKQALSPIASDEDIAQLIRRVDQNGDGIISAEELTATRVAGLTDGIAGALEPMFSSIDLDASGLIDYNEFGKAFEGMATDEQLKNIFSELDRNGDGVISALEAVRRSSMDTEGSIKTIEDFFYRAGSPSWGLRVSMSHHQNVDAVKSFGYHTAKEMRREFSPSGTGIGVSLAAPQNGDGARSIATAFKQILGPNRVDGSHASGAWNIGFDGYLAELHKGEMVVPAGPAQALRELAAGDSPLSMASMSAPAVTMSAPPLPQFPLLSTQDVTQVMRDMQRTIEQKNEQIVELLKEVRGNTGQTRDAVMGVGKDAHQQRERQGRQLDRLNRNTKEKVRTP